MVWRLYVNGECVQTFGDGVSALDMAMFTMGEWFKCGYTAEQCEIKHEKYWLVMNKAVLAGYTGIKWGNKDVKSKSKIYRA